MSKSRENTYSHIFKGLVALLVNWGKRFIRYYLSAGTAFFVRTTYSFVWLACLVTTIYTLPIIDPAPIGIYYSQVFIFMGINSFALFLAYKLPEDKLYWFYVLHVISVLAGVNLAARIDLEYTFYHLSVGSLPLFLGAAILPVYPKPVLITSILFWIAFVVTYHNLPGSNAILEHAWSTANTMMFVSLGFAILFYSLFTNLTTAVRTAKEQLSELNEITALLNITMNENQFGLIGFDRDGHKLFERGASIERLHHSDDQIQFENMDLPNFQYQLEKAMGAPLEHLFEHFLEIEINDQNLLLRAYKLEDTILVSHMDVTHMREIEQKLRNSQKLSLIGEITSGVAHNYNNALAIALSNLEAIPEDHDPSLYKSNILPSLRAIEQSIEVSRKLLALAGRQKLQMTHFDASQTVLNMEGLIKSAIGSEIKLLIDAKQPHWIYTDRGEFESAILNLAINARNAVNPKNGKISISVGNMDRFAVVSVSDNGHGVDPEIKEKIFDPFFSTKSTQLSSGLGLSIVKGFVEQSNGFITLETQTDHTCFELHFPLCKPKRNKIPEAPALIHAPNQGNQGANNRILVVDDNMQVAKSFCRLMESLGYDADFQTSPTQALETLSTNAQYGVAFIDLSMPEMDGMSLAQNILKQRGDLIMFMITGDTSSVDGNQETIEIFDEIIIKPISAKDLKALLARYLEIEEVEPIKT